MSVFKKGDTVYTPGLGKGVVLEVEDFANDAKILFADGSYYVSGKALSFTPWPEANHVRPTKTGWWIIRKDYGAASVDLVVWTDGLTYASNTSRNYKRPVGNTITLVRFITSNEDIAKD